STLGARRVDHTGVTGGRDGPRRTRPRPGRGRRRVLLRATTRRTRGPGATGVWLTGRWPGDTGEAAPCTRRRPHVPACPAVRHRCPTPVARLATRDAGRARSPSPACASRPWPVEPRRCGERTTVPDSHERPGARATSPTTLRARRHGPATRAVMGHQQ